MALPPLGKELAPRSPENIMPLPIDRESGCPYRLLVTDDEELNRDMLSRRLQRRGYEVLTAAGGPETLAMLLGHDEPPVDLLLLDIMMPGMDGYEVLARLRERFSAAQLPVIMATARREQSDVLNALELAANDYVTKPLDFPVLLARVSLQLELLGARRALTRQVAESQRLAAELETRNGFIRSVFGRYVADAVVGDLLANPEALQLGGAKRELSFLMSDLRGFTALSERLDAQQVVTLLNIYLGAMFEVVAAHGGTINDVTGDGIFVIFGAPLAAPDHAFRATACALAMQRAMGGVNAQAAAAGLPGIEMGIGLNSGDAVLGNIGSDHHMKYGTIGANVNLTARIESFTVGGQILASESMAAALEGALIAGQSLPCDAKGCAGLLQLTEVCGLHDRRELDQPAPETIFTALRHPIAVRLGVLEGKALTQEGHPGQIVQLSAASARIATAATLEVLENLKMTFPAPGLMRWEAYGKVVARDPAPPPGGARQYTVRFTDLPPPLAAAWREAGDEEIAAA